MIDQALSCLVKELNLQWRTSTAIDEDAVILSNLVGPDGALSPANENKLVVMLIGIDEQRDLAGAGGFGRGAIVAPRTAAGLSLHVMIAAIFPPANYHEGLKALSEIFTYLQNKPKFNAQNTPQMPAAIQEINLSIEHLSYADINQIWGALRTPYQPSVNYLLRIQ